MRLAEYRSIPNGPPIPDLDPTDPIGVERWLVNAFVAMRKVATATQQVTWRGRRKRVPIFPKEVRRRWGFSENWPRIGVSFAFELADYQLILFIPALESDGSRYIKPRISRGHGDQQEAGDQ